MVGLAEGAGAGWGLEDPVRMVACTRRLPTHTDRQIWGFDEMRTISATGAEIYARAHGRDSVRLHKAPAGGKVPHQRAVFV